MAAPLQYNETRCNECGNHGLEPKSLFGASVYVCRMCEALAGQDDAVRVVERAREAISRGIDPEIFELVEAIDLIKGFHIEESHGGDGYMRTLPFVRFSISDNRLTKLNNLMLSLEMARRELTFTWFVTLMHKERLLLHLAPQFDLARLGDSEVLAMQGDAKRIASCIVRDRELSWWKK